MATTNHLAITLLETAQAQKDVTVNEALARIDAVLNTGAIDRTLSAPPGSPNEGDVYIVAAGASGDWAGQEDAIAYYDGGVWRFITPREGMRLWVNDEDTAYIRTGAQWQAETALPRGFSAAQYHVLQTLSDAASIAWDVQANPVASVTLGGNRTLANPTNVAAGGVYHLIVKQDATGGRTLDFGADYAFSGGTAPTISAAANAVDWLSFVYDGTKMLGKVEQNLL